jgi:hypothetical protein
VPRPVRRLSGQAPARGRASLPVAATQHHPQGSCGCRRPHLLADQAGGSPSTAGPSWSWNREMWVR